MRGSVIGLLVAATCTSVARAQVSLPCEGDGPSFANWCTRLPVELCFIGIKSHLTLQLHWELLNCEPEPEATGQASASLTAFRLGGFCSGPARESKFDIGPFADPLGVSSAGVSGEATGSVQHVGGWASSTVRATSGDIELATALAAGTERYRWYQRQPDDTCLFTGVVSAPVLMGVSSRGGFAWSAPGLRLVGPGSECLSLVSITVDAGSQSLDCDTVTGEPEAVPLLQLTCTRGGVTVFQGARQGTMGVGGLAGSGPYPLPSPVPGSPFDFRMDFQTFDGRHQDLNGDGRVCGDDAAAFEAALGAAIGDERYSVLLDYVFDGVIDEADARVFYCALNQQRCCPADFNADGTVDGDDLADFISAYFSENPRAEMTGDCELDADDLAD